jgi:multidrug efflux pump subunit AcrB
MPTTKELLKHFKIVLAVALIALFAVTLAIGKPTDKLTPQEKRNIKKIMLSDDPNEVWNQTVADSNDFAKAMLLDSGKVLKLKNYRDKVRKGGVTCKKRVNGKWVVKVATLEDVKHALRFDREGDDDLNYINDILMLRRCKMDGHYFKIQIGVDPNE